MAIPIIQIYSLIGTPTEANKYVGYSQERFSSDLAYAVSSGESSAQVRINSVGGNWVEAQGIYGMIKASALKIDTYNDGIAASSASLVFMAGRKRLMSAHARLMIHNCSGPAQGGIAQLEQAIEGQRAINESMATVYSNATGISLDEIRAMMAAETWLSAEEALSLGFATGIINNEKKALAPAAELNASAENLLQLQAYYAAHLPSNPSTMKHILLPILQAAAVANITAEATDEQCTAAVTAAFDELKELREKSAQQATALSEATASLTELQAQKEETDTKLKDLEQKMADEAAAQNTQKVTDLIASAVNEGRILATQVGSFTALATTNFSETQAVLSALPARKSLTEQIIAQGQDTTVTAPLTAAGAMAEIKAKTGGK
ncbi:head maturation protease, ClpP-related [Hymenobacter sp. YC55]|uniref:head maturation protease, ClpP-related n=1 Tax=Hymenobacter sp. YC55 TaxID=3034019 RepID=UPI0023F67EA4|nr:head maturation protease, ClpP-related [Hymenobacter sp. YC55]MDF7809920.1 ATP-dependent Clp protease proteolytic subunit [Hymenobacter sp. YC55]